MSTPEPPPSPRGARSVALLLGLGAVAYTAWVLEVVLSTGLDPMRTYVSELAAASEPLGGLFRATDLLAGCLVGGGALWGLVRLCREPYRGAWARLGWAGLLVFGAATAVDSRLPLSCTPTADPECAARETAGLVPATHTAHAVSSSLAMAGALVGMVALTVAARRARARSALGGVSPPFALTRLGPWIVLLELGVTAWTLASVAAFQAGRGTWLLGLGQRAQVLLIAVWLAVLALSLARVPAASGVRSAGRRWAR
ncbi:DUF998 domain-containing protein [Streptomyces sp. NPDC002851]